MNCLFRLTGFLLLTLTGFLMSVDEVKAVTVSIVVNFVDPNGNPLNNVTVKVVPTEDPSATPLYGPQTINSGATVTFDSTKLSLYTEKSVNLICTGTTGNTGTIAVNGLWSNSGRTTTIYVVIPPSGIFLVEASVRQVPTGVISGSFIPPCGDYQGSSSRRRCCHGRCR